LCFLWGNTSQVPYTNPNGPSPKGVKTLGGRGGGGVSPGDALLLNLRGMNNLENHVFACPNNAFIPRQYECLVFCARMRGFFKKKTMPCAPLRIPLPGFPVCIDSHVQFGRTARGSKYKIKFPAPLLPFKGGLGCESYFLLTKSPDVPCHYRYLVLGPLLHPSCGIEWCYFVIARVPVYTVIDNCEICFFQRCWSRNCLS